MTTINCSLVCAYQEEGKCTLDKVSVNSVSPTSDCVFFQPKAPRENSGGNQTA